MAVLLVKHTTHPERLVKGQGNLFEPLGELLAWLYVLTTCRPRAGSLPRPFGYFWAPKVTHSLAQGKSNMLFRARQINTNDYLFSASSSVMSRLYCAKSVYSIACNPACSAAAQNSALSSIKITSSGNTPSRSTAIRYASCSGLA